MSAVAAGGCEGGQAARSAILSGETQLIDAAGASLGRPQGLAVAADGAYWISDASGALVAFDSTGAFRVRLGRRGGGPQEFRVPSALAFVADAEPDQLVITDAGGGRLLQLEMRAPLESAKVLRRVAMRGVVVNGAVDAAGGIILPLVDVESGTVAVRWPADRDSLFRVGSAPTGLARFEPILRDFRASAVLSLGDGFGVVVPYLDSVISYSATGSRRGAIPIPRLHRRRVTADIADRWRSIESPVDRLRLIALPAAAAWNQADSTIAVAFAEPVSLSRALDDGTLRLWVTVMSRDGAAYCTDLLVDNLPLTDFAASIRGGVLHVLTAGTDGFVVRRYRVDRAACPAILG
jgi:hypothetical protein